MAGLVNRPAAKAEPPVDRAHRVDHVELVEPGLLSYFPDRRIGKGLAGLHMTFGKSPVAMRIANQQDEHPLPVVSEHHTAGGRLALLLQISGLPRRSSHFTALRSSCAIGVAFPSINCRTTGSVVCRISSGVPHWRTFPS